MLSVNLLSCVKRTEHQRRIARYRRTLQMSLGAAQWRAEDEEPRSTDCASHSPGGNVRMSWPADAHSVGAPFCFPLVQRNRSSCCCVVGLLHPPPPLLVYWPGLMSTLCSPGNLLASSKCGSEPSHSWRCLQTSSSPDVVCLICTTTGKIR